MKHTREGQAEGRRFQNKTESDDTINKKETNTGVDNQDVI